MEKMKTELLILKLTRVVTWIVAALFLFFIIKIQFVETPLKEKTNMYNACGFAWSTCYLVNIATYVLEWFTKNIEKTNKL